MKLKLDENLSRRAADLIRSAGHDALTVVTQGLRGAADEAVFEACKHEGRALVTLDRDFGEVLRYPPGASAGIVILEVAPRVTHAALLDRVRGTSPCAQYPVARRCIVDRRTRASADPPGVRW